MFYTAESIEQLSEQFAQLPGIGRKTAHRLALYVLKMPREEVVKQFTSKVPLKRLARIEDLVAVTLFLASGGADYMTGQAINVTGGREMH